MATNEKRIRVLVVDDALLVRKIITDILSADPDIEVVGSASNGKFALEKIPQLQPTIVTLDMEMPELNGIDTLKQIRISWPKLPVIMFSALTEVGAKETLDALAFGASDYVTKPSASGGAEAAKEIIREQLIAKIKGLSPKLPGRTIVRTPTPVIKRAAATGKISILAIGVSTGGPNALADLFSTFPHTFPVPIVITQHMPPMFTRMLAERLTMKGCPPAVEGAEGMELRAGNIYLAPGDFHMEFYRKEGKVFIHLQQEAPVNSCRPAVDVMFRSVVDVYGAQSLGVILTGMGYDGLRGSELIRNAGGQVIAQDEATSVVWGMPAAVSDAGLADMVLPLGAIKDEICRRVALHTMFAYKPEASADTVTVVTT